jgi:hypothetical protein
MGQDFGGEGVMKWTDEEIDKLRDMAKCGLTAVQMSVIIKRTAESIVKKAQKLKIAMHGHAHRDLRFRLTQGLPLIREDYPGFSRWTTATRSGETFDASHCAALVRYGFLVQQGPHYVEAQRDIA